MAEKEGNRMKQRAFAGLALAFAVTMLTGTPARAENQSMTVQYTVASAYTLTVPSTTQEIAYGTAATNLTIKVAGNISTDERVQVTVADGVLSAGDNKTLAYTITDGSAARNGTGFTWSSGDASAGKEETAVLNIAQEAWDQAAGGTYTGQVVFMAELVNENSGS